MELTCSLLKTVISNLKSDDRDQIKPCFKAFKEVVGNSTVVVCSITVLEQAESIYVPIWCWTGSLIIVALVYVFLKNVYNKHYLSSYATESNLNNDLGIPQVSSSTYLIEEEKQQAEKSAKTKKTGRMKSVDVLRGFCLCIMIFVNYGAGGYSFLVSN